MIHSFTPLHLLNLKIRLELTITSACFTPWMKGMVHSFVSGNREPWFFKSGAASRNSSRAHGSLIGLEAWFTHLFKGTRKSEKPCLLDWVAASGNLSRAHAAFIGLRSWVTHLFKCMKNLWFSHEAKSPKVGAPGFNKPSWMPKDVNRMSSLCVCAKQHRNAWQQLSDFQIDTVPLWHS